MMASAQLGLTAGRRVDHIYDFSGILGLDSVADQRVGSDSDWSQAKEITLQHLLSISSTPWCGYTKSQSGVPDPEAAFAAEGSIVAEEQETGSPMETRKLFSAPRKIYSIILGTEACLGAR